MKQQASHLAACVVYNMLQSRNVSGSRYGFSIQGSGKIRAQGWCLTQLVRKRLALRHHLCWSLPVLLAKPELLLKVARVVPLVSGNVLAFMFLCYALLCENPSFLHARMVYASLSCLFGRLDLKYCFGYLLHGKHGWPEVIYNCLEE